MRRSPTLSVFVLVLLVVGLAMPAGAERPTPSGTFTGEIAGAEYEIRVPEEWNGTLLVYAHGYSFNLPSASAGPNDALEDALLSMGYALAGSAYSSGGWAVKEGIEDTRLLTNRFNGLVGNPDRVILWGFSMGSIIAYHSAEHYEDVYDGVISLCAVGAGSPEAWDGALALSLALDAVGWWDTEAWGPPSDVNDDLVFGSPGAPPFDDVADQFAARVFADPERFQKLLFLHTVTDIIPWLDASGVPTDLATVLGMSEADRNTAIGNTLGALVPWLFVDLFFGTQARGELEQRARGPVVQNLDDTYALDPLEQAFLGGAGIDPTTWLMAMNSTDVAPTPHSRQYIERYADYTGDLEMPVLSVHTWFDGLVPPAHQDAYAETVASAGTSDQLVQAFTDGMGHCAFTGPQLIEAIVAMDQWLQTGIAPDPGSFTADGWLDDYTPPDWPY